jgi:hypothetical protein
MAAADRTRPMYFSTSPSIAFSSDSRSVIEAVLWHIATSKPASWVAVVVHQS